MKNIRFELRGVSPLFMHSERLLNPLDPLVRELKAITSKRSKTDDDLIEVARLEHLGGLYYNETVGVHVPGYNVFRAIVEGGKFRKLGTSITRSAMIEEDLIPLVYDGPKEPAALFEDRRFADFRGVGIGQKKVIRCRPRFNAWSIKFGITFDENALQREDIERAVSDAGRMVGIGDYRPRFGRFAVETIH